MNLSHGGKQSQLRDTMITEDILGPVEEYSATKSTGDIITYRRLKPGDIQHFTFRVGDLPPFKDPNAPELDCTIKIAKKRKRGDKNNANEDVEQEIKGYIGQPKGIIQILVERGLYREGMRGSLTEKEKAKLLLAGKKIPDSELDAPLVLSQCRDFKEEKGALQELVESRGGVLVLSPKCHPEVAGCGVEYSWGKSKQVFRRDKNDGVAAHLQKNVVSSIDTLDVLPLGRIMKFERRTRDYRRMYREIAHNVKTGKQKECDVTYKSLEIMQKTFKTHRNIGEIERLFLRSPIRPTNN